TRRERLGAAQVGIPWDSSRALLFDVWRIGSKESDTSRGSRCTEPTCGEWQQRFTNDHIRVVLQRGLSNRCRTPVRGAGDLTVGPLLTPRTSKAAQYPLRSILEMTH